MSAYALPPATPIAPAPTIGAGLGTPISPLGSPVSPHPGIGAGLGINNYPNPQLPQHPLAAPPPATPAGAIPPESPYAEQQYPLMHAIAPAPGTPMLAPPPNIAPGTSPDYLAALHSIYGTPVPGVTPDGSPIHPLLAPFIAAHPLLSATTTPQASLRAQAIPNAKTPLGRGELSSHDLAALAHALHQHSQRLFAMGH